MILFAVLLSAALQAPVLVVPVAGSQQSAQIIRAGAAVRLETVSPLDSRSMRQGQRIKLRLVDDVMWGSEIVIARGTAAVGEIEALTGKGMFGKPASFTLRPLFIEYEGRRLNLNGTYRQTGSGAVSAAAVTTVLTGGLGLIITGKNATLRQGSTLYGELRDDLVLSGGEVPREFAK